MQRRRFLATTGRAGLGLGLLGLGACSSNEAPPAQSPAAAPGSDPAPAPWFRISLAQWSLHRAFGDGTLANADFAGVARETFGIGGIEFVNRFFPDNFRDDYLAELNRRAEEHNVRQLLIMVDHEGDLGDTDAAARRRAVENHHRWVDTAAALGCHSIRVNAAGSGSREAVAEAASDGLRRLAEYAGPAGINVLVENHGGYSSDGSWLAGVIENTEMGNCGTLPDFGNFCVERNDPKDYSKGCKDEYDRYRGVRELMPYARAVSAKTHDFAADGAEEHTDYGRMLDIVREANYDGWVGIEYEGDGLSEEEGIRRSVDLLLAHGGQF